MKTHVSYRGVSEREPIVHELRRQGTKLDRRLKKFNPDLIDLHVSLERRVGRVILFVASVTLYLPSAQLNAREEAARPVIALKHACAELLRELMKFQARLRGEDKLRRLSRRRGLVLR